MRVKTNKKHKKTHRYYKSWKERELEEYMYECLVKSRNFTDSADIRKFNHHTNKTIVKFDTDKDNPFYEYIENGDI
jgi:hypothetical protein